MALHPLAQLVHKYKAIIFVIVTVAANLLIEFLRLFTCKKYSRKLPINGRVRRLDLALADCCSISVCLPSTVMVVTVRMTEIVQRSKSMASHFSPNISPRRNP